MAGILFATFIGLATIACIALVIWGSERPLLTAGPPATRPVAPLERTVERGIMAGMVAAFVMGLFAMVVAATRGLGLYTPLYLVTAVVEPGPLQVSLNEAAEGWRFYLEIGPAAAGMAVHLAIGAGFGTVFALLARAVGLRGLVA